MNAESMQDQLLQEQEGSDVHVGTKGRKRGRRPDRILALLRTTLLKLLEARSFDEITTKDIIVEAGISSASFYRHYRTKSDLLSAIVNKELDILVEMSTSFVLSTEVASLGQIHYINEHKALWSLLLNGGAASLVREGFISRLSKQYSSKNPRPETWLPTDLGILFSVSASVEVIAWWLRQTDPPPIETVAEMLERLAIRPTLVNYLR